MPPKRRNGGDEPPIGRGFDAHRKTQPAHVAADDLCVPVPCHRGQPQEANQDLVVGQVGDFTGELVCRPVKGVLRDCMIVARVVSGRIVLEGLAAELRGTDQLRRAHLLVPSCPRVGGCCRRLWLRLSTVRAEGGPTQQEKKLLARQWLARRVRGMVLSDTVIAARDLVKDYPGIRAVDGVTLEVKRGEIFGMVGPNGAGKTTTIECLEGLRRPDSGTVEVLGLDPLRSPYELRDMVGIQFQSAALPDRLRVWEALDLFASFYRQPADWRTLLGQMGLEEKRNDYFGKLSGGQKQRLFIALALVGSPRLVFFDELTTGLDPQARRAMWDLIRDIREQGATVFLTTHFMEEAERLCDRVAVMDHGKVVAMDSPVALVASLAAEYRVVFEVEPASQVASLQNVAGAVRVERIGDRVVVYGRRDGLIGGVVSALESQGIHFTNLRTEQPTLEDVFLTLTGREMRG